MEKVSKEHISNELVKFVQTTILDSSITITADTPFKDIGIDSMSIIELVLFIERKFNVPISDKDLVPDNLKSINTLAECTYKCM